MEWVDVIAVGDEPRLHKRIEDISSVYDLSLRKYDGVESLFQAYSTGPMGKVTVVGLNKKRDFNSILTDIQTARQAQHAGFLIIITPKKLPPDDSNKLKKNGADLVLIENEALYSSKLEFAVSQKVRALFIPIKPHELIVGTAPKFKIFHVMPLNHKFLVVNYPGRMISATKHEKMIEVGELYVQRDDFENFRNYVDNGQFEDTYGDLARCRGHFVALSISFTDLVLLIVDESESKSFDAGKQLYESVLNLTQSLLDNLDSSLHPWDIINHASIGDFGAVVRSPAVAAYAGLMSKRAGIGEPIEVMIAAMMADIGMLELSPETTQKVQELGEGNLPEEYEAEYRLHPIKSLNACLSRRLPLPEKVKTVITSTHERIDGEGYPSKLKANKIPMEAQLIQFCELIDNATMVQMGKARQKWQEVALEVYEREKQSQERLSFTLLEGVKSFFT